MFMNEDLNKVSMLENNQPSLKSKEKYVPYSKSLHNEELLKRKKTPTG